jgi:methyl-accepting chemotaxis protein
MQKLSFQQKLWVPLFCSLLCITALSIFNAMQIRGIHIEERKKDLSNIDDAGLSIVQGLERQVIAGALSKEAAQSQAKEMINNLRYGKSGYMSILRPDGVSVLNPIKRSTDGTNMSDFHDSKGFYVYREIAQLARTGDGSGFLSYLWVRPGATETSPKLTRVVSFRPWDWILVTGVYTDDIDEAFAQSLRVSLAVLVAVCMVLSLVVTAVNRSLRRALGGAPEYAIAVAARIATNDLSVAVQTAAADRSSLLFAMKTMQANLADTVATIRGSSDTIASASTQIAAGNMDLSERTEGQASSLEETAASMEQLTSAVTQNAEHSRQANQLAMSASDVAQQGKVVVAQVVQTMEKINGSAAHIVDIISVIDGIAFQTNILALNAAVEAARAGEQGRGFAVVASEVRNLAQRSAAAAKEVKVLIDQSSGSIAAGSALVDQAGHTMDDIVVSVKRVTAIMTAITEASAEQSTGIGHVNRAITEMDTVTQQNAALVEEAAAAAGSLQDQAAGLSELVSRFRLPAEPGSGGSAETLRIAASHPARRLELRIGRA